jgi:hypothetical protein
MKKKARISGIVSYKNEKDQTLRIPVQNCWIEEKDDDDIDIKNWTKKYGANVVAVIYWKDPSGQERETRLDDMEHSHYISTKHIVIL